MVRLALLANPRSGSGDAVDVEERLRAHGASVERFALDEVEAAIESGPERIVVAGGDGSIGCAAEAAARASVPLAVIAVGTANDFVRALGLPTELEAACGLATGGTALKPLDLARIDGRPFVNVASAGLSPLAAREAQRYKRLLGPLAYTVAALRAGMTARPVHCAVRIEGSPFFEGRAWQLSIACTGAFGGGAEINADPSDGRLDVVVLKAGPRTELIARAYGLRRGTVEQQAGVLDGAGHDVEVDSAGGHPALGFNVDGEIVESAAARFEVEARAFDVVVG